MKQAIHHGIEPEKPERRKRANVSGCQVNRRSAQRVFAVGRRTNHLAGRHRALPGPDSPLGSSRITRCRHDRRGPTSKANAVNRCQRSHTGPRDWIASHAANTGDTGCATPSAVLLCDMVGLHQNLVKTGTVA
ncbi:hypothetical protein RAD15_15230 [Bradyrhizobium sp. 14AA]